MLYNFHESDIEGQISEEFLVIEKEGGDENDDFLQKIVNLLSSSFVENLIDCLKVMPLVFTPLGT